MAFGKFTKDSPKTSIESMKAKGLSMMVLGNSTMLLSAGLDNSHFLSKVVFIASIVINLWAIAYLASVLAVQKKK